MKHLLFVLMMSFGSFALASDYECVDFSKIGSDSILTIDGNVFHWNELGVSAQSEGVYSSIQNAPYSEWRGYYEFDLVDFERSEDSGWIIAVQPELYLGSSRGHVVVYFNNDDHPEQIQTYECFLR